MPRISDVTFSARNSPRWGASACSTFFTPAICDAPLAASPAPCPATSTWMSPPSFCAAATALSVAFLIVLLSCSAITSMDMIFLKVSGRIHRPHRSFSYDLGFVAELVHQRLRVRDFHAGLALGRLDDLEGRQPGRNIDAERIGLQHLERLLLRLHDVRQRDVARLVQAQ